MKQLIFMVAFVTLITGHSHAQLVEPMPNGGFEQWDTLDNYLDPKGWFTLNALTDVGYDATTELTTEANSGNFAVKLSSKEGPFSDLSGVLCSGPILTPTLQPDFSKTKMAFIKRPSALRLYYKSSFAKPDTSIMAYVLTKWNSTTQVADTVGVASFEVSESNGSYKLAVIDFKYYSSATPDSAFFIASSSKDGFNPTTGSVLYLDDLALLYYNTGTEEKAAKEIGLSVWPNPSKTELNIHANERLRSIRVYTLQGKLMHETTCSTSEYQLNLSEIPEGLYIVNIETESTTKQVRVLVK